MSLQSVLVTGANRGIGLEFVRQLLSSSSPPIHLIATTRQSSNSELEKLRRENKSLHLLELDTTNFDRLSDFAHKVKQIVGDDGIDTLINNAGISITTSLDDVTAEDMIKNFTVNTVAPLMITKALLPLLKISGEKRKTVVINMSSGLSSMSAYLPAIGFYPYRTSKAAVNMVSKCLANDLKNDAIIVIPMDPGWVKTDMGGPDALYDPYTSISNMLNTIKNIKESDAGKLIKHNGSIIPY